MPASIVVVGSLNMDLVVRAPRMSAPGETLFGSDFHTIPGGKGANQAVAAARLGGQVTMVGRVGDDAFGPTLIHGLAQAGVETRFVQRDTGAATGIALIVLDASGQNSIIVASGANMRLTPDDVSAAETVIASASAIVLQLESPLAAVERALALARQHRVATILNPAPAQPLSNRLLKLVDFLIPNETEMALLTGTPVDDHSLRAGQALVAASSAAGRLRTMGAGTVIMTLGSNGALLVCDETLHLPAYQVPVVDTTAAGDAFVGAFAVALAEGRPVIEAVRWANAAGALAVTKLGAQPSMPTRAELEAFLDATRTTYHALR